MLETNRSFPTFAGHRGRPHGVWEQGLAANLASFRAGLASIQRAIVRWPSMIGFIFDRIDGAMIMVLMTVR